MIADKVMPGFQSRLYSRITAAAEEGSSSQSTAAVDTVTISGSAQPNDGIKRKPILIGHRGAASLAPENTLASFRKAWENGAEMVELDVQRTKDGHLVVIHDDSVDRTTDGKGIVKDMTLGELKALDAGSWFSYEFRGEKIPTLEEVLDWSRGKIRIDMEIKNSKQYPGIEKQITELIEKKGMEKEVIVTSFDPDCIKKMEKLSNEIGSGVLLAPAPLLGAPIGAGLGLAVGILSCVNPLITAGLTALGGLAGLLISRDMSANYVIGESGKKAADIFLPHWTAVSGKMINEAHKRGTYVFAWTAHKPKWIYRLLSQYGIDGIITDNPERFARTDWLSLKGLTA
jgi:glycerophosphoryl diester phosphodiesterase